MTTRILGKTLSFDTKETQCSDDELLQSPQLKSSCSDQDILAADFRWIVKQVEPVSNNLGEEDQALCHGVMDTLCATNATTNRIKWDATSNSERKKR